MTRTQLAVALASAISILELDKSSNPIVNPQTFGYRPPSKLFYDPVARDKLQEKLAAILSAVIEGPVTEDKVQQVEGSFSLLLGK